MEEPKTGKEATSVRHSTHGSFRDNAELAQQTKCLMRQSPNWETAPAYMREGLDMIQHKIARILYGDPNFEDHWVDIAGYAEAVLRAKRG